jgi:hypothetical protein
MRGVLTRFVSAAAIACLAIPAWSASMPDIGTKNFSPGGDTPSYFSNEYGAPAVAADEITDDGADDAPHRSLRASEPRHHAAAWGYRARVTATHGSGYHVRLVSHATRFGNAKSTRVAAMAARANRRITRAP